jgi:hypothetical protein
MKRILTTAGLLFLAALSTIGLPKMTAQNLGAQHPEAERAGPIFAESFRHGPTRVTEQSFEIKLNPQNARYRERIKDMAGNDRYEVTVTGFANHAGTTPMAERQDALLAASHLTIAVRQIVTSEPGRQVGTVGRLEVTPNAPNVIPGVVSIYRWKGAVETAEECLLIVKSSRELFDALADFAHQVPQHALLLYIHIIEGGNMPARRHHDVAGSKRVRVRQGNHVIRKDPGIFG